MFKTKEQKEIVSELNQLGYDIKHNNELINLIDIKNNLIIMNYNIEKNNYYFNNSNNVYDFKILNEIMKLFYKYVNNSNKAEYYKKLIENYNRFSVKLIKNDSNEIVSAALLYNNHVQLMSYNLREHRFYDFDNEKYYTFGISDRFGFNLIMKLQLKIDFVKYVEELDKYISNENRITLKQLRKDHNLSQKEIALQLGLDMRTWQAYENFERKVPTNNKKLISLFFNVPEEKIKFDK